jgi:hypothetical protein
MDTAVQVIWWIGLIGALPATLVILKQLFNVLRALRHILELAELIRDAARQTAHNTAVITELDAVLEPVTNLRQAVKSSVQAVTSLSQKVVVKPTKEAVNP